MAANQGIRRGLSKDFLLQALYISIAVAVGIVAVTLVIEDVLIKQALRGEAEFYWDALETRPDLALPETRNMVSYRDGIGEGIPAHLENMTLGFHRVEHPKKALAFVTQRDQQRLIQVFDTGRLDWLITWFGLVPLATVLAGVYMSLYQAYRVSSRAVSPIIDLSKRVKQLDPANPNDSLFDDLDYASSHDEIQTLTVAMQDLSKRLAQFSKREFDFTRDASHELRSPLTVIKIAVESLTSRASLSDSDKKLLSRVESATQDMEELTNAFLLLARESDHSMPTDWISVNSAVATEIDRNQLLIGEKNIDVITDADCHLSIKAPDKVLASVIGNVLRNSIAYTDEGNVSLLIRGHKLIIEDTGPGMDEFELTQLFKPFNRGNRERRRGGYGVGLTIVKRLCDRFDWPLEVDSKVGIGTKVQIHFPAANKTDLNHS